MEFRLLGPVELWAHGRQIPFPSTKVKHLYAALVWDPGTLVPTSTLIRRVWGDEAPPRELASLQANVSKLRRTLSQCDDPSIKLTQISMGYRLVVPTECIDRNQFERTVSLADAAVDRADVNEAIRLLRSAEALVRSEEPLTGLTGRWVAEIRAVLEERIREVAVKRITLQLRLGDTHAVLPELHRLAAKHEFDELILGLLMRTLRAVGRTTDALDAFTLYQARLRDQKGLDPRPPLKRLHEELLRDDPAPAAHAAGPGPGPKPAAAHAPQRPLPPDTLDRDPPSFVGRRQDIDTITAEIDSQLTAGASVLCAIDGMPGIGKTTLALHIAHRLRDLCPDGALQLCLRAHDEHQTPTDPETALALLLEMLGVKPSRIQRAGSLDYLISLWRTNTSGKRLLVLLDDAADAEQIAPLVPGGAGVVVLVTARNRLTGLPDAARLTLEPLPDADASALFIAAARMSPTSDPALRDVVAACGGFPLALAVAGKTLRARQAWSLSDLAEHLASSRSTHARKPDSIIGPLFRVFSTSYRDLPEAERVLLRRLSLSPGPRIHFRAAAALADADPGETDCALLNLVEKNLLDEPARRYYQLHDMARIFATYACEVEELPEAREAAVDRLVRYTLGAVDAATELFHPHRHTALVNITAGDGDRHDFGFSDAKQAARWLDTEHAWLRTIIEHWFANGYPREAAALVHMIAKFLERKGVWRDSIVLHQESLAVWRNAGDHAGEAFALTDLASVLWRLDDFDQALRCAEQALTLWSESAEPSGQADALLLAGRAHHAQHRNSKAIKCFRRCVALRKTEKDDHGRAIALYHLGAALFDSGHHRAGVIHTQQALRIIRTVPDELLECDCINNLGVFNLQMGEYEEAEAYFQQALSLVQRLGNNHSIGVVAINLAAIQTRLNRPEAALPLLERAAEIFQQAGNRRIEVHILINRARAEAKLGRAQSAQALLDNADLIAEQLGDPAFAAEILLTRGDMSAADGSYDIAVNCYEYALPHAEAAEDQILQARICHEMGNAMSAVRNQEGARRNWHRALLLYGTGHVADAADLRERLTEKGAA